MLTLEVVKASKIIERLDILGVEEKIDAIDAHFGEIVAEIFVSDDLNKILQKTLKAATLFDTVADALVEVRKASLTWWYLRLDPSCELEGVVECIKVGCIVFYLVKNFMQIGLGIEFVVIESSDLADGVHSSCLSQEVLHADLLNEC